MQELLTEVFDHLKEAHDELTNIDSDVERALTLIEVSQEALLEALNDQDDEEQEEGDVELDDEDIEPDDFNGDDDDEF